MPPLTPAITLAGNLKNIFGASVNNAAMVFQLCGYGAQPPRIAATAMLASTAPLKVDCPAGSYNKTLFGNDVIAPAGTYYTVQIIDDQGNVIQTSAYQLNGSGTFALEDLSPYPIVTVVLPGSSVNGTLVTMAFGATVQFNGTQGTPTSYVVTYKMILTGNVTLATFINVVAGCIYIFDIIQDGVGSHTFSWPGNVVNPVTINDVAGGKTFQAFVGMDDGSLYPIGAGVYN